MNLSQAPVLTGLFLKNFQSISEPFFLSLNNITLLYGPNSSGKSSILDALKLVGYAINKGSNPTGYNQGHLLENSGERPFIGIEYIHGDLDEYEANVAEWSNQRDSTGDNFFKEFHKAIKGRRVQVEFSDRFSTIKIAIAGDPLFEIVGGGVDVSSVNTKFVGPQTKAVHSEYYIGGTLVVYKMCKFYKLIESYLEDFYCEGSIVLKRATGRQFLSSGLHKTYHYPLFIEDNEETISIHGVTLSLAGDGWFPQIMELCLEVENVLFRNYPNEEYLKECSRSERDFLREHFYPKAKDYRRYLDQRRALYWKLNDLVGDFRLLVEGFILQLQSAVKSSHVAGNRTILDSKLPFSSGIAPTAAWRTCLRLASDDVHLQKFALSFTDDSLDSYVDEARFVDKCLKRYLSSLKGYEVIAEVHEIRKIEGKAKGAGASSSGKQFCVFLLVKNPAGKILGFQDVGSGLSYLFPILTSLSHSERSFVEQPELHLHPAAQCEMGDVFIAAFNQGSFSVIESHSEHLLLRILRRVRETSKRLRIPKELQLKPEDVAIYYFQPNALGQTAVRRIRVDQQGELLDYWPGGFFSERDAELFS
jgi:hypothetical protein